MEVSLRLLVIVACRREKKIKIKIKNNKAI